MPFFRWCEILISILCREMEVDLRDLSPFIAVRYSILVHGVNCGSGFTFCWLCCTLSTSIRSWCILLCSVVAFWEVWLADVMHAGVNSRAFAVTVSVFMSSSLKLTVLQIEWWLSLLVGLGVCPLVPVLTIVYIGSLFLSSLLILYAFIPLPQFAVDLPSIISLSPVQ